MPAGAASFSDQHQNPLNIASDFMRPVYSTTRHVLSQWLLYEYVPPYVIYKKFGICPHGSCLHVSYHSKNKHCFLKHQTATGLNVDDVLWEVRTEIV